MGAIADISIPRSFQEPVQQPDSADGRGFPIEQFLALLVGIGGCTWMGARHHWRGLSERLAVLGSHVATGVLCV